MPSRPAIRQRVFDSVEGGDSGPSPKAITSGTYLQHVAFAEQFLEGDITSSGRVRLVWSCDGDKPGLYLGEQRLFEGGEGGRQRDASSQLCTWSSLDRSDIISSLLGHEVLLEQTRCPSSAACPGPVPLLLQGSILQPLSASLPWRPQSNISLAATLNHPSFFFSAFAGQSRVPYKGQSLVWLVLKQEALS